MNNFSIKNGVIFLFVIILSFVFIYNKFLKRSFIEKTFIAKLEKSNFWATGEFSELGFKGEWIDRPDGIEEEKVFLKIMPALDGTVNEFLVAYEANISLKSQSNKLLD